MFYMISQTTGIRDYYGLFKSGTLTFNTILSGYGFCVFCSSYYFAGYILVSSITLVVVTEMVKSPTHNTRHSLGGSLYVWLIPMVQLEAFSRASLFDATSLQGKHWQCIHMLAILL